ncbi:hypothetical protein PIIN_06507 [Serendipita indica DSM 11827]|uniref:Uncharacterized protein n=1 Tax=Serendipita indica (strain DSM 11827) TaxID=1109443 RepID=G4TMM7_SERID|nr:hypothetical protein PIIN_06507 [Serendipita indica DSM 11827]
MDAFPQYAFSLMTQAAPLSVSAGPVRPNVGGVNNAWIAAQFWGHPDAERLRSILRSFLDTDSWQENTPARDKCLDMFVKNRTCQFCLGQNGTPAAQCVRQHLCYNPR